MLANDATLSTHKVTLTVDSTRAFSMFAVGVMKIFTTIANIGEIAQTVLTFISPTTFFTHVETVRIVFGTAPRF